MPIFNTTGQGLISAIINFPNVFHVYSKTIPTAEIEITIKGEQKCTTKKQTEMKGDLNVTTVTYIPIIAGKYTIEMLYKDKPIRSAIEIYAREAFDLLCSVKPRLYKKVSGCCGIKYMYLIDSSAYPDALWDFQVYAVDGSEEVFVKKIQLEKGLLLIGFRTTQDKKYVLHFTDRGLNLPGSPFFIE